MASRQKAHRGGKFFQPPKRWRAQAYRRGAPAKGGVAIRAGCRQIGTISALSLAITARKKMRTSSWFIKFSTSLAKMSGHASTFVGAAALVVIWAVTGPFFHYSDTWQLIINTSTTIITFLMVFLIQNTQNRDTAAMQLKLDELIRATDQAHNALLILEELDEKALDRFHKHYRKLAENARQNLDDLETQLNKPVKTMP
jgi:low affinity Fe/Cu permease